MLAEQKHKLIQIMNTHEHLIRDLEVVRQLHLPHGCISAGYVRNYVWDYLHGYSTRTPLNDVDILYYDPEDLSEETEKKHETRLKTALQEYNWSCKNQARMHIRNQASPYLSIPDAMRRWPETVTAVAIRLDHYNKIEVIAPHGLDDIFSLVVRRSPHFPDKAYFHSRVESKRWLELWPKLTVIED